MASVSLQSPVNQPVAQKQQAVSAPVEKASLKIASDSSAIESNTSRSVDRYQPGNSSQLAVPTSKELYEKRVELMEVGEERKERLEAEQREREEKLEQARKEYQERLEAEIKRA